MVYTTSDWPRGETVSADNEPKQEGWSSTRERGHRREAHIRCGGGRRRRRRFGVAVWLLLWLFQKRSIEPKTKKRRGP